MTFDDFHLTRILDHMVEGRCGNCGLPQSEHLNDVFCPDALEWGARFRPWWEPGQPGSCGEET